MKRFHTAGFWTTAATVAALMTAPAQAATWGGGNGDWASDNWGLNSPDGYPGDPNYPTEGATISTGGQININAGDNIELAAVAFVSNGTINQTGGSAVFDTRLDVRTQYDLTGGVLTGNGSFRVNGATLNVDGGMFGTRVTAPTGHGADNTVLSFQGNGNSTLLVTEDGIVDVHTLSMNEQATGGNALVEVHGVITSGGAYDRSTLFWRLYKNSAANSATARFVFSAAGITPWTLISNNSLNLGTGTDRGLLEVDVSALTSDGTTGHTLIDYRIAIQGDGTFGGVTITDATLGNLTPGTFGSLAPGEYFLDMTGGAESDDIVLYYNNIVPEPASMALLGLGGLFIASRHRR